MLDRISIKGFRALKDVQLELPAGKPVVLIGENASGKSSILDAVELLCAAASGRIQRAIIDRGGWGAIAWGGTSAEIEIRARFSKESPVFKREGAPVEYMIRLGTVRSFPAVLDEEIRVFKRGLDQKPFVSLKGGATRWASNIQTKVDDPVATENEGASIVTDSVLAAMFDGARYPTPTHMKEALMSIAFYPSFALGAFSGAEGAPESMNTRQLERTPRVSRNGRDLLNALHTLSQEQQPRAWTALLADLRAVFPWCTDLRFPAGPGRGLVMLTWVDARSGASLYLDDMSEGMRVYLALLAALHADDAPSLIAFDEPERSLHPGAIRRLVKVIESRAEQTPILIATHADRLLDHLEDPAASLRVTRFAKGTGVSVGALDGDLLDAWRREYSLSELRAQGMLEGPSDADDPSS